MHEIGGADNKVNLAWPAVVSHTYLSVCLPI